MSYERLLSEHDRIDQALAKLRRLTEAAVPDVAAVSLALSDLATELGDHLAHEDSFIYPRMIESAVGQVATIARKFVDEFAALTADWNVYLVAWPPESIAADWAGFRADTDAIGTRLAARVRAENGVLYTAALNHGLIPLRD